MSDFLTTIQGIPNFDFNIRLNGAPYATSSGINPTVFGNPTAIAGLVASNPDNAVRFNGTDALLKYTLANPLTYADKINTGWTISFVVQRTAAHQFSNLLLMDFADDINWYGQYSSVGIYWYGSTLYTTSNANSYSSIYSGATADLNKHTITLAHNSSPTVSGMRLKLYFDGVLAGSLQSPGPGSGANSKYLRLGTAFDMFFGTSFVMDEVCTFQRELSIGEIQSIHSAAMASAPAVVLPEGLTTAEVVKIVRDAGLIPDNANQTMARVAIDTSDALSAPYDADMSKGNIVKGWR